MKGNSKRTRERGDDDIIMDDLSDSCVPQKRKTLSDATIPRKKARQESCDEISDDDTEFLTRKPAEPLVADSEGTLRLHFKNPSYVLISPHS